MNNKKSYSRVDPKNTDYPTYKVESIRKILRLYCHREMISHGQGLVDRMEAIFAKLGDEVKCNADYDGNQIVTRTIANDFLGAKSTALRKPGAIEVFENFIALEKKLPDYEKLLNWPSTAIVWGDTVTKLRTNNDVADEHKEDVFPSDRMFGVFVNQDRAIYLVYLTSIPSSETWQIVINYYDYIPYFSEALGNIDRAICNSKTMQRIYRIVENNIKNIQSSFRISYEGLIARGYETEKGTISKEGFVMEESKDMSPLKILCQSTDRYYYDQSLRTPASQDSPPAPEHIYLKDVHFSFATIEEPFKTNAIRSYFYNKNERPCSDFESCLTIDLYPVSELGKDFQKYFDSVFTVVG